jgi:hypothetical protein
MANSGEDEEMKEADDEPIETAPGFAAAEKTRVSSAAAGGASLDDVNNNLRLLVDAVRRLTEVVATHVYMPFSYASYELIFDRLTFRLVTGLSNLDQVQMTWIRNWLATGFGERHPTAQTHKTLSHRNWDCYFCNRCGSRMMHKYEGDSTVSVKAGCLESFDLRGSKERR